MKFFDYHNFDLGTLIGAKREKKRSVGVALPVYNEAKTLSRTIKAMKRCGELIDELIVIDSGSSDGSQSICRDFGVRFIKAESASRILGVPYKRGKGWNLWASVYFLNTDLIIWVDADIRNIGPRFITGIAGPLITDDRLKFVKGYYHRPKGDARVTEIVVRPFSGLIFPEVSGFVQPLSGEYGGFREFLERINFYSGYSVEMAILLQAVHNLEEAEIGQSYLGKRFHELQNVQSLGKMSGEILHTMLRMAQLYRKLKITGSLTDSFRQFFSRDGIVFSSIESDIADKQLPSLASVAAYREKFKIRAYDE